MELLRESAELPAPIQGWAVLRGWDNAVTLLFASGEEDL